MIGSSVTTCNDIGMRDNSKILAVGMAINMPAIAAPMKSEAYERKRKPVEEEKAEEKKGRMFKLLIQMLLCAMSRQLKLIIQEATGIKEIETILHKRFTHKCGISILNNN